MCVCVCACLRVCVRVCVCTRQDGLVHVFSVSVSHAVGHWFAPQPGHTKDHNNKSCPARQQSSLVLVCVCVYIYQLNIFNTQKTSKLTQIF